MSIAFKIAPLVSSASLPKATEMIGLAEAFNSRLRSGLADCTKRIHQYAFNLTRQIRNPAEDGLTFPSLGEFSSYYQHLDFDDTPATWPVAGKGDYEGANVASPAAQFVFGIGDEESGEPGEGDYLTTYDFFKLGSDTTPEAHWELAKAQRGAYDPNTGAQSAPMFNLAQRYFRLTFPNWSRHHKSPGGYLPTIQQSYTECRVTNAETGEYFLIPNYIYKFRPITEGYQPYTGSGTCGEDYDLGDQWITSGGSSSDIYSVAEYPFAWYVYQFDGQVFRFDKENYVLVKDAGGVLAREDGGQIERLMINPFIADYRGTEFQRYQTCFETKYIDYAFANQDFYTTQYQLAPAYGVESGELIEAIYPSYTWTTAQSSGSKVEVTSIPNGFRLGGHLIKQRKLTSDVSMRVLKNGQVIHHFTASIASGSMVETFLNGPETGSIEYQFTSPLTFDDATGYLLIETSVLIDYKPEIWDGYAIIRLSSAQGAIGDDTMDIRGIDFEYSRQIYDTYRSFGCFLNINGAVGVEQQQAAINTNPVFDAMRKYINSYSKTINGTDMRIPGRPMLVGYEVSQSINGSQTGSYSVLYFNRYQAGTGLTTNNVDCFAGLINVENSQSNGIVTTAPIQGYTNEWVLELCGKPYHTSDSSIWEPGVYANYFPYINRCHLAPSQYEAGPIYGKDLFRFFQENNTLTLTDLRNKLLAPESLTAYTYDYGQGARQQLNKLNYNEADSGEVAIATNFYKSCKVYPKPYVITSITEQAGSVVKVVLDRRLDYCSGSAPEGVIANNVAGWVWNDIVAEPYRSDENIVRLFLFKMFDSSKNPQAKTGDNAVNSSIQFDPDNPFASIYPTFFLTKLIPKPFLNDGIENTGSLDYSGSLPRAYDLQLCETYLRSICEGFVDETLSVDEACNTEYSTDYDYTYTNLCLDAFGKPWISNITGSQRSDYPRTYGPLPDMEMNTQVFNQIARAVNKLVMVRLPLPYKIRMKTRTYEDSTNMVPSWPGGSSCNRDGFDRAIQFGFVPVAASTLVSETDYQDASSGIASTTIRVECNGTNYKLITRRQTLDFQFDVTDQLAWNAVSEDLRAITSGSGQSAAIFATSLEQSHVVDMELSEIPSPCGDQENWWLDSSSGMYYVDVGPNEQEAACRYVEGGIELDAGALPTTDIAVGSIPGPTIGQQVTCDSLPGISTEVGVINTRHWIIIVPTES